MPIHYPPCDSSRSCARGELNCCTQGLKNMWHGLIGMNRDVAIGIIEKDNPDVTVVVITPDRIPPFDFCCNRVFLLVDKDAHNGKVLKDPVVG